MWTETYANEKAALLKVSTEYATHESPRFKPGTMQMNTASPLEKCELLELPKIQDQRGNLTFVEAERHVPFNFKRAYFLYDVPGGSTRGGHAHKSLHQLIIAMSGSFDITLTDGNSCRRFHLNRSYFGLFIPPMVWRDMDNFSSGSVALVLASEYFDENDYYRNFDDYLEARGIRHGHSLP